MGVVESLGSQVRNFNPGQRVAMASPVTMRPKGKGTFQQFSAVPQTSLVSGRHIYHILTAATFHIVEAVNFLLS